MSPQLGAALAAEEAAIYAYGVLGVHLGGRGDVTEARAAEQAHRGRRDYVVAKLAQLGASAAPSPAGYALPFAVTDRASALKLAIHVEDGVAQAWRPLLPATTGADRTTALAAMTEAAVRATRWRRLAAVSPVTLPFPGRPE
ncbi:ferritin-like domain-containing protein [Paractinoplanes lichenicola]|uniref:Ferritin-like domain-containing protein n=1 Tax=Paractinoplanes lichenicola TaxID=2802976 RepID=A0ABS1VFX2_9ACTN|nr:ferritin-like domain-containing protein [Actinoplanes lichenicola]MBL7253597.1 ferritin-like domain-containing protein [Actinoplanes lichenicola]